MTAMISATASSQTAIGQLLLKFTQGDTSMLSHVADDIDFQIAHYKDDADASWQTARSINEFLTVLERLGKEVFPKGTSALGIDTFSLKEGWHLTCFNQRFFYGVRQRDVTSLTHIISHEADGKVDFFRETVTDIVNV